MATTLATSLTPDQLNALAEIRARIADRSAVVTLAGLAGTGKTFLLRELLRELREADWRILLTAPTHQALAVAREGLAADVETMTIHAALGLTVHEREDGTTSVARRVSPKLRGYHLVVVDEASMVGAELYQEFMRNRECAVLFVGDPGQLPPVGERESPAFAEVAGRLSLTSIVRQAEGSPLITLAHAIRELAENGQRVRLDLLRPHAEGAAQIVDGNLQTVTEYVADAISSGFRAVGITYRNEDVDRINAGAHRALYPSSTLPYEPGERVLFRAPWHRPGEENREPVVRTNEMGTVVSLSDVVESPFDLPMRNLTVELDSGREYMFPVPVNPVTWRRAVSALFAEHRSAKARAALARGSEADALREVARAASAHAWRLRSWFAAVQHAYALTAHRSQGSTYDIAVLHWRGLGMMRDDFEHARAVYVAATRASQFLVIVE